MGHGSRSASKHMQELEIILTTLRKRRVLVRKTLSRLPEGRLLISSSGPYYEYINVETVDGRRVRRFIGRDRGLVLKLARRRYLEEELTRLDRNIELLEKTIPKSCSLETSDVLKAMPRNFDILDPMEIMSGRSAGNWPNPSRDPSVRPHAPMLSLESTTPAAWAAEPYCENTSYLEYKTQVTARGVLCRSKSEAGILGIYDRKGIYYHCDETLTIAGSRVSPDVIGARSDGVLIYHEHCGVQSASYSDRLNHKLWLYEQAGIVPGKNLLLTFDDESGNINLAVVEAMVEDMFF